jgi:acetyl esterase
MKSSQNKAAIVVWLFAFAISSQSEGQSCSTGKVDDRVAAFLKSQKAERTPAQWSSLSTKELKTETNTGFTPLPKDSVKQIKITQEAIRVNIVKASPRRDLPVMIRFHEGNFVKPLLPSMEYEALRLSKKFDMLVFDVDYRVAPEHKFPVASNDAYAAFLWVLEHAKEYGGDPNKIVLVGMEAGANLVALVSHKAKKENKLNLIKSLVLICPSVDNPMISYYDSFENNATGFYFTKAESFFGYQSFLDKKEWFIDHPSIFPIHEKDFTGFPPTLLVTAEFDVLRDEGIAYGKKLEKAGCDVSIKCMQHQIHNFAGIDREDAEWKRIDELMKEVMTRGFANQK